MKNSRDGKSYSTNLAYTPPEFLRTGICVFYNITIFDISMKFNEKNLPNSLISLHVQEFLRCLYFILYTQSIILQQLIIR
jgi:hypothetical protein